MSIIEELKQEEGFGGMPYKDHLGYPTIGYGTKLPINEEEAELLLIARLNEFKLEVQHELPQLYIEEDAWEILYAMAYQMGVAGLLKFKKMISALERQNYYQASLEGRDSKWYSQTPKRAERLMSRMQNL